MKKILIIFLFCVSCFAKEYKDIADFRNQEKNNYFSEIKVDLNQDGVKDIFAYEDFKKDGFLFINKNNKYIFKYKIDTKTFDGLFNIINIKSEKSKNAMFSLTTMFSGAGGLQKKYFYKIKDEKVLLVQHMYLVNVNVYMKSTKKYKLYGKICIFSNDFKETKCYLNDSKKALSGKAINDFHYLNKKDIQKLMKKYKEIKENDY